MLKQILLFALIAAALAANLRSAQPDNSRAHPFTSPKDKIVNSARSKQANAIKNAIAHTDNSPLAKENRILNKLVKQVLPSHFTQ